MKNQPFETFGEDRRGDIVVLCDHATNIVPPCINGGDLGLPPGDMGRHIAYDVGARGLSQALGTLLDAPVVCSRFSRLVIDPNRGEDDPTLLMKLYDGSVIPANRDADAQEVERRLEAFHRPYHAEVERVTAMRDDPVLISVHSFTAQLRGRLPRPWHVGILSADDRRLSDPLLALLNAQPDLVVGDNEPYSGALPGDTLDRHGIVPGRLHTLVELRNDLIAEPEGQQAWAGRLAPLLAQAISEVKEMQDG